MHWTTRVLLRGEEFFFAATSTLALNLISNPIKKEIRRELDEDQSSIANERLRKRGYLPSTFYMPSRFGFKHNNKFDFHFLNLSRSYVFPTCNTL
jgi:hypothetical protein